MRSRPAGVKSTDAGGEYSAARSARRWARTRQALAHRLEAPPRTHPPRVLQCTRRGRERSAALRAFHATIVRQYLRGMSRGTVYAVLAAASAACPTPYLPTAAPPEVLARDL